MNAYSDACEIVPANSKNVFTVGTTTQEDEMDTQSCYGKCVDILAPGMCVFVQQRVKLYLMM